MKIYDEYVIRLMEAYLTGKLDDAGRKELEAWCGACEKNRKFFERVCREDRIAGRCRCMRRWTGRRLSGIFRNASGDGSG